MSFRLLALTLTGVAISAGAAHADLPAATYRASGNVYASDFNGGYYGGNFHPLTTAGTVGLFSTTTTMGAAPSPYIDMHMSLVGDQYQAGERATITYAFQVLGPEDILVSLNALVVASALVDNTGNDAFGQYSVSVDAPLASGFQVADGGGTYGGHDAYDGTVNFTVRTNQINTVTLFASGYLNGTTSGHVDIYVDPVFSFATPMEGYSLAFSNGIGNALPDESVGGVPEPASWALMIGGFGLAGVALRRRRAFIPA